MDILVDELACTWNRRPTWTDCIKKFTSRYLRSRRSPTFTRADLLQYINSVIFSAPFTPSKTYLSNLPFGTPHAVYHGPTSFMPLTYDPYVAAKDMGIYQEIGNHLFQSVNAGEIVQRILRSRQLYEERQKKKGEKGVGEELHRREEMEEQAAALQRERAVNR